MIFQFSVCFKFTVTSAGVLIIRIAFKFITVLEKEQYAYPSMSNRFHDFVFIATNEENPDSKKYVVANRNEHFITLDTACGKIFFNVHQN